MLSQTEHLRKLHNTLQLSPVRKPTTVEYYQLDKIKEDINNVGVVVDCQLSTVQSLKEQNKTVVATITVKDISGQCLLDAADFVTVQTGSNDNIDAKLQSIRGGTYIVSFDFVQQGEHCIFVSIAGENISSVQPFKFYFDKEDDLETAYVYNDNNQAQDMGNVDDHSDFRSDSLEEAERACLQSLQGRRHQRTSKKTSKKRRK